MNVRADATARKDYLVFRLANREFGIALEKVQELCNYDVVKPLADAPAHIAGLATRGGRGIPVVDLHALLAPGTSENGRLTDVIILHADGHFSGIAVDCVIDVVVLGGDDILACDSGNRGNRGDQGDRGEAGIIGMAMIEQRTILLIDAHRLMTDFRPASAERLAA